MSEKKRKSFTEGKERKFTLPERARFDIRMLPVIQNLVAMGLTESDIGMVVGYQGANTVDWLHNLKKKHPEVVEACKAGARMADSFLVAQMFRSAIGYDYVEEEWGYNKDGEWVKKKESIKHQPANAQMAIFMATNRMPEQFKHRVDLTKRGLIIDNTEELSSEQIEKLAGALLEEANKTKLLTADVVDAKFVETENADSK
jgi:hypothetical protein